jgi:hypothetical protein
LKTKTKHTLLLLLLVALQTSCGVQKGKEAAEKAVEKFHNQLNAGQYHQIYTESDEGFRKGVTEETTTALFDAVRRKLGTVQQAKTTGWHVNANTGGTFVTLSYTVDFSEGKAVEQFVYKVSDGKALLFNYNINSPLLITK